MAALMINRHRAAVWIHHGEAELMIWPDQGQISVIGPTTSADLVASLP